MLEYRDINLGFSDHHASTVWHLSRIVFTWLLSAPGAREVGFAASRGHGDGRGQSQWCRPRGLR